MTDSSGRPALTERAFAWAPWWALAQVALWPTVGPAEALLTLGALFATGVLCWHRFRGGESLLPTGAWASTSLVFFLYWLPELASAPDAASPAQALREAALDLRYLPFLWLGAMAVASAGGRRITGTGLAAIALFWCADAASQALGGPSLGGAATADRLSGIFGANHLRLGLVLACLAPFLLAWARGFGVVAWGLAALLLVVLVLLAGARAAWLVLGLVLALELWRWRSRGLAAGLLALGAAAGTLAWLGSPELQQRVERTLAVGEFDDAGVDHALSGRIWIWEASLRMAAAHPLNGVGIDGFRAAYADHASPGDPFVPAEPPGAYHAHHWLLEVLSETGGIGLLCWLAAGALLWRAWRFAPAAARERAHAPFVALVALLFPLNTHPAFYGNFWGGALLLLVALMLGALLADDRRG